MVAVARAGGSDRVMATREKGEIRRRRPSRRVHVGQPPARPCSFPLLGPPSKNHHFRAASHIQPSAPRISHAFPSFHAPLPSSQRVWTQRITAIRRTQTRTGSRRIRPVRVCVCVCLCCVCVLCVLCVQLLACPRACVSQPAEQRAPDSNRAAPLAICCASPALPAVDRLTGWGSFARWIVAVVSLPRRAGSPLRPGTRRVVGLLSVTFGRTEEHGGDGDGGGQRARRCVRVCVLPYHIFLPMSFHAFPVALWLVAVFVTQLVCLFVCPQHQAMPI